MKHLTSFRLNERAYWKVYSYFLRTYGLTKTDCRLFDLLEKLTYTIARKRGINPSAIGSEEYIAFMDDVRARRPDLFGTPGC